MAHAFAAPCSSRTPCVVGRERTLRRQDARQRGACGASRRTTARSGAGPASSGQYVRRLSIVAALLSLIMLRLLERLFDDSRVRKLPSLAHPKGPSQRCANTFMQESRPLLWLRNRLPVIFLAPGWLRPVLRTSPPSPG